MNKYHMLVPPAGNEDGFFSIDRSTGAIVAERELDFEVERRHSFVVKATSNSSCIFDPDISLDLDSDATLKRVVISLNNLDDSLPRFLNESVFTGMIYQSVFSTINPWVTYPCVFYQVHFPVDIPGGLLRMSGGDASAL